MGHVSPNQLPNVRNIHSFQRGNRGKCPEEGSISKTFFFKMYGQLSCKFRNYRLLWPNTDN